MAVLVLVLLLGMDVIGMTLGWINIALYFLVVRRQLRGYSDDIGQVNVLYGLCQPLQEACNTGKKGMTCAEPGLQEDYEVYSGEPGRTFAGKSAWTTSKLAGKSSDHLGAVRLTEKDAAVFLKDQFYTWKVKLRDLPEEEQLIRNPLPVRDEAFELLNIWCSGKM